GGAAAAPRANRTLFLGNLDITVSETDLRRAFDRFGVITEVDIKRPGRGQTSTYGFLKFENLDMAHRAKLAMSGKVLLRNPIKIGYGKALVFSVPNPAYSSTQPLQRVPGAMGYSLSQPCHYF
uniref:RRM domain-containing protein n=1 Tax=Anser cygnoides TaxID=8845 RepID=A0A8B9DFR6_ANSCY